MILKNTSTSMRDFIVVIMLFCTLSPAILECKGKSQTDEAENRVVSLPEPLRAGEMTVEEALDIRRSVRTYSDEAVTVEELSQLLWAAQGITSGEGFRTAPSAGALYPLEVYAVAGNVKGLESGIYKYSPSDHTVKILRSGDFRPELFEEALQQNQVKEAAVNIVIAAVYERTMEKYGERGRRYVHMEVGHAGQNICLQAESLHLGVCPIGSFEDEGVKHVLGLLSEEEPLYILSIGKAW